MRKFNEATCRNYIRHIAEFAKFLGRSPDAANGGRRTPLPGAFVRERCTAVDAQQRDLGACASSLAQPSIDLSWRGILPACTTQGQLPRVLSPDEVGRLLEAAPGPGLKYKAALSIAYGAGLRVGEVVPRVAISSHMLASDSALYRIAFVRSCGSIAVSASALCCSPAHHSGRGTSRADLASSPMTLLSCYQAAHVSPWRLPSRLPAVIAASSLS